MVGQDSEVSGEVGGGGGEHLEGGFVLVVVG